MSQKTSFSVKLWNAFWRAMRKIGLHDTVMKLGWRLICIKRPSHYIFERKQKKRANGLEDKRYIGLKKFHNIHEGERCFIVCTGPSLTVDDVNKLKDEYTLSMNSIVLMFDKTDWRPTYYGIVDEFVYEKFQNNEAFQTLKNRFVSSAIKDKKMCRTTDYDMLLPMYRLDFARNKCATKFSDDIYSVVYAGGSVTYMMMQIAVYMGFKEIYLLGCDSDFSGVKKHFVEYTTNVSQAFDMFVVFNPEYTAVNSYKTAKKYCDEHGIKIYNATRGGKLEVFERVDFDSLFNVGNK